MDKTKSSKGVIKVIKPEKQVLPSPHCHSANKDKHFFQVEENDFPSLSEVRDKNPKSEKESSAYSASSLTYSSKLKTLLMECSSQNMKFENVRHSEPKVESVSSKGLSKNKSPLSQAGVGKHMVKPPQSVQPNCQRLTKQSSSAVYNVVPSSSKKSTDSKFNSSFSEVRNKKSESFSGCTNMKTHYGQKSVNDNRSSKTAHGESNTFERIGHSPKKGHNLHAGTSNIQKPLFSKSLPSPRNTNAVYSSTLRSDMTYKEGNYRPNISAQHKRHVEENISVNSRAGSGQSVRLSQVNVMHSNISGNTSNKARISSSGSQMSNNSVKSENNKTGNQSLNAQSSLPGPSETKKKKKRKSKLKRQAALQTGKILFLTPEVHSKIISQSNNVCVQRHQNVLTNINDNEEYPELGLAEPKTVKKAHATVTNVPTKEENPSNLVAFRSETDKKENLLVSKDSSTNGNFEAATKSDEKNKAPIEKSEGEKSIIHSNNPITLSLFDMLVTAKSRKKEPEKKDESSDENNSSAKVFKKEMIKKNVHQAVNPLASSKPTIKRGKEREKPKVKRPSRMRKLILLERQLRKENMAMKEHEAEGNDENQEQSEEILPGIHSIHGINEISVHDNFEICVENLLNYVTDAENNSETYEIYDDVNSKISEQFALDYEDVNFQSASKNQDLSEQSKLVNELLKNANQTLENHMFDFSNNKNDFNSISDSIADIQNDLVSNPDSNLTDNEKHCAEDLVDVNTVEDITEICYSIRKVSEKYSDLKYGISNAGCIDGNFMEDGKKTEISCDTYNFINKMQESNCKATDLTENIPASADCNINTKIEVNSGKRSDSTESKQSNRNLDSSEKIDSNISENSFSDQERLKATKLMLHSRKFRPYCNHFISKEIDQAVFSLIDDLARFQDRMYQKDPVKAKIRRRLVYGIKEIKKHMKLKKVKCIIIATDIEDIKIEGGLNDSLGELISLAEAYLIPCIFSHRRFNLGKVCRKSVPVSCVGIFNYEGSEKNFKKMIELHDDSKHDYLEVVKKLASELANDQVKELFEAEKESIIFVREVSQRILREKVYFTPEGYRNNDTSELLEKSANIESEDSIVVSSQQFEDSNLLMSNEKSLSFIEELKKLDKHQNLIQLNQTDINTILVKYKVVKEC